MLAGLKPVCPQGNLSRGQRVATAQEVWNSAIQGVRNRGRASVSEVDSGGFPENTWRTEGPRQVRAESLRKRGRSVGEGRLYTLRSVLACNLAVVHGHGMARARKLEGVLDGEAVALGVT